MFNTARFATAGGWRGVFCVALTMTPFAMATADSSLVPLARFEAQVVSSLRLKAANAQIDSAQHYLRKEQSAEGAQLYGGINVGRHRQVVTNDLSRTYDAVNPQIGVSYPLFDSRAQQLQAVQEARTQVQVAAIDYEDMQRVLLHDLRKDYLIYWQAWQSEQLAKRYHETLSGKLPAARKLREKGVWTDSAYLRFAGQLAVSRDDLQRFRGAQRLATGAMGAILGTEVAGFEPARPELPKVCLSDEGLSQSAERHSAALRKLHAQFEALSYERRIGVGSEVKSSVYVGLASVDEFSTGRSGYSATAGVNVNMPANFVAVERANADRLDSAAIANRVLSDQARMDARAAAAAGAENYRLAQSRLAASREQLGASRESLRETRLQFDRVPQVVFDELLQQLALEYQASVAEVENEARLLQESNDILLLAPDSCVVEKKTS